MAIGFEGTKTGEIYDYIVCGGGTTGCVVAGRLAELPGTKILLIEAGPHNEGLDSSQMVGGWNELFDSPVDWNIISKRTPNISDRDIYLHRGKFLGGTSGMNGTLCIRGTPQDYDDWGIEGWDGKEFFEYMAKSETFHPKPWFDATAEHGTSGPLHTEPRELAPISRLVMESMESQGLPYHADMFTTGNIAHGHGHVTRTHWQGCRSTGADFVTKGPGRVDRITIRTNTLVDKILLERRQGELVATGVEVLQKDLSRSVLYATKEVIVSGGSYCSPTILLRSGIGSRNDLDRVGIPCQINLPGVGRNLLDHLIVHVFYEVEPEGITTDHLIHTENGFNTAKRLWNSEKTGFLSSSPFGVASFARLDERLKDSQLWNDAPREAGRDPMGLTPQQPNIEFFNVECYGGIKEFSVFEGNKHAFGLISELFSPRSQGSVTLTSKDPQSIPVVDHNYLSDPLDVLVISEACRFGNEIVMKGKGTASVVKGSWPPEARHHTYDTREAWQEYVKYNATSGFHPAGTCKMGREDDQMAVVDGKLRVRGVKNLRVADCSIMPKLNGGHTQMPAYGIGEKAADLIKETIKSKDG